jgi:hypothetical protein
MISSRSPARLHDPESSMRIRHPRSRRHGGRRPSAPRGRTFEVPFEWNLERVLKGNASALTFLGITLGVFISRRFFALPLAVGLMMAQDTLGAAGLARARRVVQG